MRNFGLAALFACVSVTAGAATVTLPLGSFEAPEDVDLLDKQENVNATTGKTEGLMVFGRKGDAPRAVFIITYLSDDGASMDVLEAAVKIGNPFDPSLTPKDAQEVTVGGIPGATYAGTLPNGLIAKSYVVRHNGYRLIVLLKGPDKSPYKGLLKDFAKALENFSWTAPPAAQ
jgi:hypothetical protein